MNDTDEHLSATQGGPLAAAAAPEGLPAHLVRYLADPRGWQKVKDAIVAHDATCASLTHVWTARTGGVCSPAELGECDDCHVTFYVDGLAGGYPPDWKEGDPVEVDDEGEPVDLCDCCGRSRRAARSS